MSQIGRDPDAPSERVGVFPTEALARICEGRLLAEGIPALVKAVGVGAALGNVATAPHAVLVRQRDAERARAILADDPSRWSADGETVEHLWTSNQRKTPRILALLTWAGLLALLAITVALLMQAR